jgi:membrane associated rhomboid family serine protease
MGIGSRTYARPYVGSGGLPYGIKMLLIVNVAIFLVQYFGVDTFLVHYFGLWPALSVNTIWQLVTYLFLHGNIWHIVFNMLALWMFGKDLEDVWGTQRFLNFYFFTGIGAGICVVLAYYILPGGNPNIPTIGASGAIYGILLANAVLWPDKIVYVQMLFPIKMKYFVMIYGAIAFLLTFGGGTSGVSNVAHLGGLVFAWVYMKTSLLKTARVRGGFNPIDAVQREYKAWKLARNKRKFQVYMKKQGGKTDPWVQ